MDTAHEWTEQGLCGQTDPELFFPEKGGSAVQAKKICAQCDVRLQCLEFALKTAPQAGVYGGLTLVERNRLKRNAA